MSDSTPSPSPFSRNPDLLTVREFELFREAQSKLEDEREARMKEARLAMERLIDVQLLHLKAETESRFTASDKALALASLETGRRLEMLNGEQSRLLADRERFVSDDSYQAFQKEFGAWRDQVNKFMNLGTGRDKGFGISWGVVIAIAGLLFGLAGFAAFIINLVQR